jgi:hypothetical protein
MPGGLSCPPQVNAYQGVHAAGAHLSVAVQEFTPDEVQSIIAQQRENCLMQDHMSQSFSNEISLTPFTTSSTVTSDAALRPMEPPNASQDLKISCDLYPTPSPPTARNSSFLAAHAVPQAQLMKIAVALLQGLAVRICKS